MAAAWLRHSDSSEGRHAGIEEPQRVCSVSVTLRTNTAQPRRPCTACRPAPAEKCKPAAVCPGGRSRWGVSAVGQQAKLATKAKTWESSRDSFVLSTNVASHRRRVEGLNLDRGQLHSSPLRPRGRPRNPTN